MCIQERGQQCIRVAASSRPAAVAASKGAQQPKLETLPSPGDVSQDTGSEYPS